MQLITLTNQSGLSIELADYGARLIDVQIPGGLSLLAGYQNTSDYLSDTAYVGATIGPIANRIRNGEFSIGDKCYRLEQNIGEHSLHSGALSFAHRTWTVIEQTTHSATFSLDLDPQLEGRSQMFPGRLQVLAKYELVDKQIVLIYSANTDQHTYLNITNHSYWNLNKVESTTKKPDIKNHRFSLYATGFAIKDAGDIPTGAIHELSSPVNYTFGDSHLPPELRDQVDHHFIQDDRLPVDKDGCRLMASIQSHDNAVKLQVSGTKPGFQFYTGQYLSQPLSAFDGFCIEPQFMPNAINLESAQSPLTTPHKPYRQIIKFGLDW